MSKITNGVLYYIGHAFNIEYFAQFVNEKRNILRKNKGGCKMPIYTNIKKACKQKGISVTKLETDLGFARSTIYKWDTHQPGIGKLKKVSDYLGVTMEYLLADQKESA
nr:MAG TPA: repressor protein [Caudoviricetes sp.]